MIESVSSPRKRLLAKSTTWDWDNMGQIRESIWIRRKGGVRTLARLLNEVNGAYQLNNIWSARWRQQIITLRHYNNIIKLTFLFDKSILEGCETSQILMNLFKDNMGRAFYLRARRAHCWNIMVLHEILRSICHHWRYPVRHKGPYSRKLTTFIPVLFIILYSCIYYYQPIRSHLFSTFYSWAKPGITLHWSVLRETRVNPDLVQD